MSEPKRDERWDGKEDHWHDFWLSHPSWPWNRDPDDAGHPQPSHRQVQAPVSVVIAVVVTWAIVLAGAVLIWSIRA